MAKFCRNCDPQPGKIIKTKDGKCVDCGRPINPTHAEPTTCKCVEVFDESRKEKN